MALKEITENEKDALRQMYEFTEAYVDYYCDYVNNPETDAHRMNGCLPLIKSVIDKPAKSIPKPAKRASTPKPTTYEEVQNLIASVPKLRDYVRMIERWAKESRNPNYEYCVTDTHTTRLWLTNNYEKALSFSKTQSKIGTESYTVYAIKKEEDGTYKLHRDCSYLGGEYMKASFNDESYLHYNYLAEMVGETNIFKIE